MDWLIRHAMNWMETSAACIALALLLAISGCSRDSATASTSRTAAPATPPTASIRSAEVNLARKPPRADGIELFVPDKQDEPVEEVIEETSVTDVDDAPAEPATIDPEPLDQESAEPAEDALLAALEQYEGNLDAALKAISVRIEHSTRGDIILLNLKGPGITDAAFEKIKTLDNLLVLDVWDAPITDNGLKHLAGMTQMRALGLRGTRITDNGLKNLAKLKSLKELNLTLTRVSDRGMRHLTGLKSLHALGLDDTSVTGAGINELQTSLPLCRIAW